MKRNYFKEFFDFHLECKIDTAFLWTIPELPIRYNDETTVCRSTMRVRIRLRQTVKEKEVLVTQNNADRIYCNFDYFKQKLTIPSIWQIWNVLSVTSWKQKSQLKKNLMNYAWNRSIRDSLTLRWKAENGCKRTFWQHYQNGNL